MKYIKLSPRLRTIADFIDIGASVADIGTDHGYLPVYLAQTGIAHGIVASDISAASLSAARRSAKQAGVTGAINFLVTPGLDGIVSAKVDTIVIAGMGGETILSILRNAPWTKNGKIKLILQPQSKLDILFRFLYNDGYEIREIKSILDRGKQYTVILIAGDNTT